MAAFWNPQAVLKTYPDSQRFTCVGVTKRGTRCQLAMISRADLGEASELLNLISFYPPRSRAVRDQLPQIAYLTLCPRWHRKPGYCQVTEMVQKWLIMIEDYCTSTGTTRATTIARSLPAPSSRSQPRLAAGSGEIDDAEGSYRRAYGTSRSPVEEVRPRLPRPSQEDTVDPVAATSAPSAPRRPSSRASQPAVPSTPPRSRDQASANLPVSQVHARPLHSSSQLSTPPATPPPRNSRSAATRPADDTNASPPQPSTSLDPVTPESRTSTASTPASTPPSHNDRSAAIRPSDSGNVSPSQPSTGVNPVTPESRTSTPSTPASTPCNRPHTVRRKSITENCCICWEPICCADDAVWCRAQCGQNVHRECFSHWKTQTIQRVEQARMDDGERRPGLEERLRAVTCVFCRARWRWEWED